MATNKIVTGDLGNLFLASYLYSRLLFKRVKLSKIQLCVLIACYVYFKVGLFSKNRLVYYMLGKTAKPCYLNAYINALVSLGYVDLVKPCLSIGHNKRLSAVYRISPSGLQFITDFEKLLMKEANKLKAVDYSFKNNVEGQKKRREALKKFTDY